MASRRIRCRHCNTLHLPTEQCWRCKADIADAALIGQLNSKPHQFVTRPGLLPSGKRVQFAYRGVPGVWVRDEDGNSWCVGRIEDFVAC